MENDMWSYYGAKTNLIEYYPKPVHDTIIEPFAGSARYALKYFEKNVLLIDKYPVIVKVWKWLQKCSEQDVLKLPRRLKEGDRLSDLSFDCEEARLFMGFIVGCGLERPRDKAPARKTTVRPNHINYNLQRVAKNLFKIRHWKIEEGDYTDAPDITATWFVDPPYQHGGYVYVKSSRDIDFNSLREWSISRKGQVIVCENSKADWMPFVPLVKQRGSLKTTTECFWTNHRINHGIQKELFIGKEAI
jgi:site-specific DNA-adenine methylase